MVTEIQQHPCGSAVCAKVKSNHDDVLNHLPVNRVPAGPVCSHFLKQVHRLPQRCRTELPATPKHISHFPQGSHSPGAAPEHKGYGWGWGWGGLKRSCCVSTACAASSYCRAAHHLDAETAGTTRKSPPCQKHRPTDAPRRRRSRHEGQRTAETQTAAATTGSHAASNVKRKCFKSFHSTGLASLQPERGHRHPARACAGDTECSF